MDGKMTINRRKLLQTLPAAGLLAAQIGQKRAREIWFLCRQYDADTATFTDIGELITEFETTRPRWAPRTTPG